MKNLSYKRFSKYGLKKIKKYVADTSATCSVLSDMLDKRIDILPNVAVLDTAMREISQENNSLSLADFHQWHEMPVLMLYTHLIRQSGRVSDALPAATRMLEHSAIFHNARMTDPFTAIPTSELSKIINRDFNIDEYQAMSRPLSLVFAHFLNKKNFNDLLSLKQEVEHKIRLNRQQIAYEYETSFEVVFGERNPVRYFLPAMFMANKPLISLLYRDELAKLGKPSRAQYTTDIIEYDFNDNIARAMLSCEFEKRLKTVFADGDMKFFCNQIKVEAGYDQLLCLEEAIRVIKVGTGR